MVKICGRKTADRLLLCKLAEVVLHAVSHGTSTASITPMKWIWIYILSHCISILSRNWMLLAITFGCPMHDASVVCCAHLQARWPPTRIPCNMLTAPLRLQMVRCTLMAMSSLLADVLFLPLTKVSNFRVYWNEHIYVFATLHTCTLPFPPQAHAAQVTGLWQNSDPMIGLLDGCVRNSRFFYILKCTFIANYVDLTMVHA